MQICIGACVVASTAYAVLVALCKAANRQQGPADPSSLLSSEQYLWHLLLVMHLLLVHC